MSSIGTPVAVRVLLDANPGAEAGPDALAVRGFVKLAALSQPPSGLAFLNVQVDNRGQIDTVTLPKDIDVLDGRGIGANFRPAYDVVDELEQPLQKDTVSAKMGARLLQRLALRNDLVRPGRLVRVLYVSLDPLTSIGRVVINGSLARRTGP